MTTAEYLGQIERLELMIKNKEIEIQRLELMARGLSSPALGDKVQTSSSKDKLGDAVSAMEDEITKLMYIIKYYLELRSKIIAQIDDMNDNSYYQVLTLRFVHDMTYDDISTEIDRTKRQTIRRTEDAMDAFEKMYGHLYLKRKSIIK